MKNLTTFFILLTTLFCISCRPGERKTAKDNSFSEKKDSVSVYGPRTMVRHVRQGKKGTILIAASFGGVLRYDGKFFTTLTASLGKRRFWDVLEDRRGDLWISTTDSGIYYYPSASSGAGARSFQHFTTKNGLVSNAVGAIYEDRAGHIWFASSKGASRYDGHSFRNFTVKDGLSHADVTTILEDRKGRIWIATRGDLNIYDGTRFTTFKNEAGKPFYNVWSIIEDGKGKIWFGGSIIQDRKGKKLWTDDGLWRYDGHTVIKVSSRGASFIIQDQKGNIWTTGNVQPPYGKVWALSRYDHTSLDQEKPAVTEIMSITGNGMLCGILAADDGSIWFGALGVESGVYRYNGKKITDFKEKAEQASLK